MFAASERVLKSFAICLLILGLAQPQAQAQAQAQAQVSSAAAKKQTTEMVIITAPPAEKQSRWRAFLDRLGGKARSQKLETTGSEVMLVPKREAGHLKKKLEQLGAKVTRLHEDWHKILRSKKEGTTPAQKQMIDKASRSPETVNVGVLHMPNAAAAELALTRFEQSVGTKGQRGPPEDRYAKVVLPLNDGREIVLVRNIPVIKSENGVTWVGETEETGERALLMLWKDGHLSGYFGYKGHVFVVNHVDNDIHTMTEMDPSKLPPDHASGRDGQQAQRPKPPAEPAVAPFRDADRKSLEAKPVIIDVMLLYTRNATKHYVRDPRDLMALAIEQANYTFRNSALANVSLRLVHHEQIDYDETGAEQFDHLYRMVDGVGVFKDIKRLRNEKRADIVGLIVDDASGCGLSTRVGADAEDAYFLVHHSCAAITYSIAHEIGHILGARHDRAVDQNETPFPFAHGYVNGTKWRDMMSYREGCDGCPRIPYWSNPRVLYKGEPTGTPASDNARVILEQAERVANFR